MTELTRLPGALKAFKEADFFVQLKARFVFYLIVSAMVILSILIPIFAYLQISSSVHGAIHLPVFIPMVAALFTFMLCYLLLIRGYFLASANLLIISSLTIIWVIMFLSDNPGIARLDTVVWLFAILAMAPLIIDKRRGFSLGLTLFNVILLVVFLFLIRGSLEISDYEFNDFLVNSTVALVFLGIVSYNIYAINKSAIEKAEADIQSRKKVEIELRKSEAKYRNLYNTMPNGFYRSTPEGYFIDANPAFVKMLGYSNLEELKKIYIPTELYVEASERTEVTASSEFSPTAVTYRLKRKDGQIIWLEENARFIKDKNGKVLFHEGICSNITDRKKAEDALQESEADLKSIIENSVDSIWSLNKNYDLKYVNHVFADDFRRIFGIQLEKGTNLLQALPQPIRHIWKERYDQVLAGESMVFEDMVENEGQKVYIEVSANPIALNDKIVGACFFGRNTTKKKLAEEELRQSKELFKTLFEAAPVDIALTDENGRYLLVNQLYANKLNLPATAVIGKTAQEVGISIDEQYISQELTQKGFAEGLEITCKFNDGKTGYYYYNGNQITINGEKCLLSTSLEITEKKKIEKELEDYKNNLELLVQERTEELTTANEELKAINDELYHKNHIISTQKEDLERAISSMKALQIKLIQSEKMASLGVLTAGVAHEINNPINFIANGTAAIESIISEKHRESLIELNPLFEAINDGVKRVTGIIRSMSKYNRNEALPASHCNIHEIIDDGLTLLYNQYKTRIKITKSYTSDDPVIIAHEGQLHQVFLNVLANAIQAIEKEGDIHIKTQNLEDHVKITITDNGTGIAEEHINNIFDPFYTTKDPGKGTGLGLSITHRIITDHNGTIYCKSILNNGSSFVIELPHNPEKA